METDNHGDVMGTVKFQLIDVFGEERFQGNQLAVFLFPGRDLKTEVMQKIAKEMNLSETTFVLERDESSGKMVYNTRIFTVEEELPFAGHPTLGTAFVLSNMYNENTITLRLKVGDIPVSFTKENGRMFGEMVQKDPVFGSVHDPVKVAKLLNLKREDIDDSVPIQTVSTGNAFVMVPIHGLEALEKIRPDLYRMEEYLEKSDGKFFYLVSRETVSQKSVLHARMLFYGGEDPATGSAAGPATAWMLKYGILEPEEHAQIEQGIEMGRPSLIYARGSLKNGNPCNIRIGGHCSIVAHGELEF